LPSLGEHSKSTTTTCNDLCREEACELARLYSQW
jgi:hypothetical protein